MDWRTCTRPASVSAPDVCTAKSFRPLIHLDCFLALISESQIRLRRNERNHGRHINHINQVIGDSGSQRIRPFRALTDLWSLGVLLSACS